jgi:hypothetical protein
VILLIAVAAVVAVFALQRSCHRLDVTPEAEREIEKAKRR